MAAAEVEKSSDKVESPSIQVVGGKERKESDLPSAIKALEQEVLQVAELAEIERTQLVDISSHLKLVLRQFDGPLHIDPLSFSPEVTLNSEGTVSLSNDGEKISSIEFEALPGRVMIKLLLEVVPEIKRLLQEKRQSIGTRAMLLERSSKEFKKVAGALPSK